MNKVPKPEGKVIGEPMEIPRFGMYVHFLIPRQPRKHNGAYYGNERKRALDNCGTSYHLRVF